MCSFCKIERRVKTPSLLLLWQERVLVREETLRWVASRADSTELARVVAGEAVDEGVTALG